MSEKQVLVGVGVAVRYNGRYVFLKRKGSHGAGEWSFPGGHLEFGETVEACVKREVEEELGVQCTNISTLKTWTEDKFPEFGKEYITLYMHADIDSEPYIAEPDKASDIKFVDIDNELLPTPIFSGVATACATINYRNT